MSVSLALFLPWALFAAAILHILEEFVLPGGFPAWYRHYRAEDAASVTPRFLLWINAALLAATADAAWAIHSSHGVPFWLLMSGLIASNGVWHLVAAARSHSYSPGMVTGALLYVPLAVFGLAYFLHTDAISTTAALLATAVGATYTWWSALFHQRGRAVEA